MLTVVREYYSIQTSLIYRSPVDDLDDYHFGEINYVFWLSCLKMKNPCLFEGKAKGTSGPKFRYSKIRNVGFICFCYF